MTGKEMMRPIKFRAWDKVKKVMMVPRDIQTDLDGNIFYIEANSPTGEYDEGDLDVFKLEQFTGLTDVNGKDIYEGDIIQYSDHFYAYSIDGVPDLKTEYIGVVAKNNWSLGILINRISHTDEYINQYNAKEFVPFCKFDDPEADVLLKGNVHTNPELLEVEDEG